MRKLLIPTMALLALGGNANAGDIFTSGCKEIAEKANFEKLDITPLTFEHIQLATGTIQFKTGERSVFISNKKPDINAYRAWLSLTGNMWLISSSAKGQEKQLNIIAATGSKSCEPVAAGEKFIGASFEAFNQGTTERLVDFDNSACFIEVFKQVKEENATSFRVAPTRFNIAARAISLYDGTNQHVYFFKTDADYANAVATTIRGSWFLYMPKEPIPVKDLKQDTKGLIVTKWMGISANNKSCLPLGGNTLPYRLIPPAVLAKMNLKN